eukprot:220266-Alexandrium_andersonii.AAC.1
MCSFPRLTRPRPGDMQDRCDGRAGGRAGPSISLCLFPFSFSLLSSTASPRQAAEPSVPP